jgi:hypothetical protein
MAFTRLSVCWLGKLSLYVSVENVPTIQRKGVIRRQKNACSIAFTGETMMPGFTISPESPLIYSRQCGGDTKQPAVVDHLHILLKPQTRQRLAEHNPILL